MTSIKLPSGVFEYDPFKPLGNPGGFGQVFLGSGPDGKEVAIKKLHVSADAAAHRELRIADELKGRNFHHVVPVIDAGQDAETSSYFVVMTKAECSLQDRIDADGLLAPAEAATILLQIADGLIEVGDLVHRDLKPDNILFHNGKWKIADFGIARFVEEATASNTLKNFLSPLYAAPEQWRSERATHATDIYALGCIAFCLISGKPPFTTNPQMEHLNSSVPQSGCSEQRLSTLINMCLRKFSESRPSLHRIRDLLQGIVASPLSSGKVGSFGALAAAAARVSNEEQAAQALQEQIRADKKARQNLASEAFNNLAGNIDRLWEVIQSAAANAMRETRVDGREFIFKIGDGRLQIDLPITKVVEPNTFKECGWDVVSAAKISATNRRSPYMWSASLWFMKLKGAADFRWYEASYWSLSGNHSNPHYENPGRDADLAASNVMHSVNLAYGPLAIDDENENDFHNRWVWLLTEATLGKLAPPSQLPISKLPPF